MNKQSAKSQAAEQTVVADAQPVIVTDVVAPADGQLEQVVPAPIRRSSAARFMADLLKPVANRVAAQAPKAHLWELIKFLNAVDHGNAAAARDLAEGMLELTLTMSAVVSAQSATPVAAEAPAVTAQKLHTSAARLTADLLKPVATRIAARTPKAIAWELIKFYNAVDHRNQASATELAHALYQATVLLVNQAANQRLSTQEFAATRRATSEEEGIAGDLLPDF